MRGKRGKVSEQILITVVGLACVLALFQFLIRLPAIRQVDGLERERLRIVTEIEQAQVWADEIAGLESKVAEQEERVGELGELIPGSIWIPGLLVCVEELAAASGAVIEGITVFDPEPVDLWYRVRVHMTARGDYGSLLMLMQAIEGLPLVILREQLLLAAGEGLTGVFEWAIVVDPEGRDSVWPRPVPSETTRRDDPFSSGGEDNGL